MRSFFTENLHRSLIWSGHTPKTYKVHSFRIGAATTASMMGVSEEHIQRMGRWRSQAFKKYINHYNVAAHVGVPACFSKD